MILAEGLLSLGLAVSAMSATPTTRAITPSTSSRSHLPPDSFVSRSEPTSRQTKSGWGHLSLIALAASC